MTNWEYITCFLEARVKDRETRQFIKEKLDKKARRNSPEAMIPELNRFGAAGWELVHMEPVPRVNGREKIGFDPYSWSNTYFCVFKRPKAAEPIVPLPGEQTPPTP